MRQEFTRVCPWRWSKPEGGYVSHWNTVRVAVLMCVTGLAGCGPTDGGMSRWSAGVIDPDRKGIQYAFARQNPLR